MSDLTDLESVSEEKATKVLMPENLSKDDLTKLRIAAGIKDSGVKINEDGAFVIDEEAYKDLQVKQEIVLADFDEPQEIDLITPTILEEDKDPFSDNPAEVKGNPQTSAKDPLTKKEIAKLIGFGAGGLIVALVITGFAGGFIQEFAQKKVLESRRPSKLMVNLAKMGSFKHMKCKGLKLRSRDLAVIDIDNATFDTTDFTDARALYERIALTSDFRIWSEGSEWTNVRLVDYDLYKTRFNIVFAGYSTMAVTGWDEGRSLIYVLDEDGDKFVVSMDNSLMEKFE